MLHAVRMRRTTSGETQRLRCGTTTVDEGYILASGIEISVMKKVCLLRYRGAGRFYLSTVTLFVDFRKIQDTIKPLMKEYFVLTSGLSSIAAPERKLTLTNVLNMNCL